MSTSVEPLQLLYEHIRLSLLERKRAPMSGAEPNNRTLHGISRSLDTLLRGIESLEREHRQHEAVEDLPPEILRERHHDLSILRSKSADLQAQFSTETTSKPGNASDLVIEPGYRTEYSFHESVARESLTGSSRSPGSLLKSNKTVRFRDSLVDTDEMQNRQVLQLHHRVMEEQDESLDRLSASIRNQRELSIQIGDELEDHARLLGDIDTSVDLHQTRLDSAMRKLNRVAQLVKDNGSLATIIILIIVLVLVIVIVK